MLHYKSQARIAILDVKEKYFFCPYTSLTQRTLLFPVLVLIMIARERPCCAEEELQLPVGVGGARPRHHQTLTTTETAGYPSIHGTLIFILKRGSLSQHEQNHNEIYDGRKPY
jgi:hypothetical protein